jgi:hypothetical protein
MKLMTVDSTVFFRLLLSQLVVTHNNLMNIDYLIKGVYAGNTFIQG